MYSSIELLFVLLIALAALSSSYAFQQIGLRKTNNNALSIRRGDLEMKGKGKRVPIDQRGEFLKQQRMLEARAAVEKDKPDGVPVFKVFVRPVAGGLWIPCGDLAGDQRATALVNAWMSGFLTDMYKGQLDQGIARSIFSQEDNSQAVS